MNSKLTTLKELTKIATLFSWSSQCKRLFKFQKPVLTVVSVLHYLNSDDILIIEPTPSIIYVGVLSHMIINTSSLTLLHSCQETYTYRIYL
jgi:hypothetical protein